MGAVSLLLTFLLIIIRLTRYFSRSSYSNNYDSTPLPPKKVPVEKKEVIPGNPFYTNAPEHWGVITDEFLTSNQNFVENLNDNKSDYVESRRRWMVNSLVLMGTINDALQKKKGSKIQPSYSDAVFENAQYATSCCVEKLFEKGIISTTGIVIDNYDRYGVILCEEPTPIQYINELRDCFIEDGYVDLIYFAVNDPNTVIIPMPLKFEPFNKTCFRFDKAKQGHSYWKYNEYAMWWAGEKEPHFSSAVIRDDIRIYLDMLDFHNSYALGILSFAFGLKNNNNRTKLPEYDEVLISGPEGVEIIITLSAQRGINFHFPALPRYEKYRNKFIKVYVNFCYSIRAQILEHDLPNDSFETVSTLDWYNQLLEAEANGKESITSLGFITK